MNDALWWAVGWKEQPSITMGFLLMCLERETVFDSHHLDAYFRLLEKQAPYFPKVISNYNMLKASSYFHLFVSLVCLFFSVGGLLISIVLQYFLEEKRSLHFVNSVAEPYHNFLLFTLLILHHLRTY